MKINKRNAKYWENRSIENAKKIWKSTEELEKELAKEYTKARETLEKELLAVLNTEYEADREYIKIAKTNRYQQLIKKIDDENKRLAGYTNSQLDSHLFEVYKDSYYRTIYDIQRGLGIGASFVVMNSYAIRDVVATNWNGVGYSDRLYRNANDVAISTKEVIVQGLIKGESNYDMTRKLSAKASIGVNNAHRIVRTETAHFLAEGTRQGYIGSNLVDKYKIIATLDSRTSNICRQQDNKIYKLADWTEGVNAPLFHIGCRTTTCVYFDDVDYSKYERIANENGNYYKVSADISYADWLQTNNIQ